VFLRQVGEAIEAVGGIGMVSALLQEHARHPDLLERYRRGLVEPRLAVLRTIITRGQARGDLPEALDPKALGRMLMGSWIAEHITDGPPGPDWPERLIGVRWPLLAR
jgi:Tetracyclin repressor-like, C-terminal domain